MMFYVSKLVWFFAQPSSLLVLGMAGGVTLVRAGRVEAGLKWMAGSLAVLVLLGMTALGDLVTAPLERRYSRPALDGRAIEAIIVLGGAEDSNGRSRELMGLNEAAERMTEAVALARLVPTAKLVFSGGSAAILSPSTQGATEAARLFRALGVTEDRIVVEDRSRTTYENAVHSRELLQPGPGRNYLLVTSAWHMPRAVGTFRAQGFNVLPWPVDFRAPQTINPFKVSSAVHEGLRRVDFISKEYVGLVGYYISGRM